ncbi:GNAT family N-acetyltransferase [Phenylobacterium sp.]|uniref:GNAT family N-acetyltransferase n=1 Tax=Phenylobacterium sp. TaxID=1871053 RepID=UPI0011F89ACD|nr:GNAT family N-acetyltransferase [Phenylobacterium sp.]THD62952.1 MAG: N-acetyltransferase [Phenylobacterium sp.]
MRLRPATADDAPAMGALHIAAMRTLTFLPQMHTVDEAMAWMATDVLPNGQAWIAEAEGEIAGYVVFTGDWIQQLYVRPDRQGRGVGSALLAHALADGRPKQLWTFQANARARGLYEARGFRAVSFTDGGGNEEKTPDVRYEWRP